MYSVRPKIIVTIEFKIYSIKIANFDLPITKRLNNFQKILSYKKQLTPHSFIAKDKRYFYNFTSSIGLRAQF